MKVPSAGVSSAFRIGAVSHTTDTANTVRKHSTLATMMSARLRWRIGALVMLNSSVAGLLFDAPAAPLSAHLALGCGLVPGV